MALFIRVILEEFGVVRFEVVDVTRPGNLGHYPKEVIQHTFIRSKRNVNLIQWICPQIFSFQFSI